MNRIFSLLLVSMSFFAQYSCSSEKRSEENSGEDTTKQTDIPNDYKVYKLPGELDEISGLIFIDSVNLMAVEDEEGVVYFYNLEQEKVTNKKTFGESGDYEDITIAGNALYVVSSDGELHEIKDFKSGNFNAQIIKTPFTGKNNIEGLAYDRQKNRLLLSPKDKGLDSDKDKEIYAFDLKTKKVNPAPVYSISLDLIESYFKGDALEESSKKFLKALGNKNLNEVFRPSALAIHPLNHEIYILSSINNLVAVLSPAGKLLKIIELQGKEFLQPEGMAFTPQGKLYISNEGKGGKANIIHLTL